MLRRHLRIVLAASLLGLFGLMVSAFADDQAPSPRIQEEIWALPLPIPMFAYLVRPSLPLKQFGSARHGAPTQTFDQDIDE